MTVQILRGDALHLPIADHTVDAVITSPPYFGLRSYQDGGQHYGGQVGDEATPGEFIDALIAATAEMVRVLKPSGSIFVNLGDKYSSGGRGEYSPDTSARRQVSRSRPQDDARPKSLLGIPWRYAIRCVDQLGLILRAEIIWAKPNGLPESVTDRVRRSHETWFHFTTRPRYYTAIDEIREQYAPATADRYAAGYTPSRAGVAGQTANGVLRNDNGGPPATNPLGKLPGSVWNIATQPLTVPAHIGVDHFAAFPMEWPRRLVTGWSPRHVCTACGEGRRMHWDVTGKSTYAQLKAAGNMLLGKDVGAISEPGNSGQTKDGNGRAVTYVAAPRRAVAEVCACTPSHTEPDPDSGRDRTVYDWHLWTPPPATPGIVLDPFGGTGTTALRRPHPGPSRRLR